MKGSLYPAQLYAVIFIKTVTLYATSTLYVGGLEFSKVCHYSIEYYSDQFELLLHQTYLLVALQLYNVCLEAGKRCEHYSGMAHLYNKADNSIHIGDFNLAQYNLQYRGR